MGLDGYHGVLIYGGLIIGLAAAILVVTGLLAPRVRRAGKTAPYECGVPQQGPTRIPLGVRFYLVAIIFVLFDVEAVFLIPWSVIYRDLGVSGLIEMGVFMAVLVLGLWYAWAKGILDWGPE